MGIIVTVAMLLGICALLPFIKHRLKTSQMIIIGRFLLLAGLWNALWFGLGHLTIFWGQAALVSGIAMVLSALLIIKDCEDPLLATNPLIKAGFGPSQVLAPVIVAILVASAGLYLITLIRLNLGLSIIQ